MNRKIYKLLSLTKRGLFALALVVSGKAHSQQTYSFSFTGAVQTQTLPSGTWGIECWGANGGSITSVGGEGKGGYSKGEINIVTAGTQLSIFVGGRGTAATGLLSGSAGAGGWNGGGGGSQIGCTGAGGGGATDVRIGGIAPSNRVIVAGGGGGAAGYYTQTPNGLIAAGGNGGGVAGVNGNTLTSGGVLTVGGGGQGATGAAPGLASVGGSADGTATGGGGGAYSAGGASAGGQGTGGGAGGYAGVSGGGSTGAAAGGGGGYAGGAGGVQSNNGAAAGGGGSGYIGGVTNGITSQTTQTGYVANPDASGNGYVILTRLCDVNVIASKNPICAGESVVLSTNAGSGISWNTGATTSSIVVSPSTTTEYTVSGASSSSIACTSTVTILVKVNPLPVITAVAFPPVFCAGASGSLVASGAITFTWSNGTTGISTLVSPTVNTVYTATGTSIDGCKNTATVMANVNTNSLTVTPNATICNGNSTNLTASGVTSALWNNTLAFLTIVASPSVTTVYSVTGIDPLGCTLSNTVQVTVNNLPVVTASSNKQTVCRGETITLSATGASSYIWDNGDTTPTSTRTLAVNIPYHYSVTGTDANGCSSSAAITVNALACTGVNENVISTTSIFPNPATKEITVSTNGGGKKQITVTDLLGKVVLSEEAAGSVCKFSVENLPAGLYNVRVQEDNLITNNKFVKQ